MTVKNHFMFWIATIAAFIGFVALFKSILLPFILGMAIAYFLNPTVEKLGRIKIGRAFASLLILITFFLVVIGFFAALVPVLIKELSGLSNDLPALIEKLAIHIDPYLDQIRGWDGSQNGEDLQSMIAQHAKTAASVAGGFAKSLASGSLAIIDFLSLVVITPIMAYFMMKEWPHITATAQDLLPRNNKDAIMNLFTEIDKKLSSFVRGQISVALLLAIGYAIALSIAGLKYGFLIGLTAGLLSVIPMVGSMVGLIVAVLVAWFQAGEWGYVAIIAGIFIAGQIIEGYILTPKLVGESVGLHPLWVFFALMAGGSLFGIVGMLLAIPVAAIASVLVAFGLHHYKKSPYYKKKQATKKKTTAQPAKLKDQDAAKKS